MAEELDINKLTAEFVQSNLDRIVGFVGQKIKVASNIVRSQYEATYTTYLSRLLTRNSKGKSFFVRSEPIPLYEFFVPLDLASERTELRNARILDITSVSPACVVAGSGGSGKSMLMRHFLVGAIEAKSKAPIFLELRQ